MFSSFILKRILRHGIERILRLLRIFFQIIFFPIRFLYYFYLRLRIFFAKKNKVLHIEFPAYFETSNKSFLVRKFQGKGTSTTRLDFLLSLRSLQKLNFLQTIKISIPPLNWSLGDVWEVAEELRTLKTKFGVEIEGYAKEGSLGTLLLLSTCSKVFLNHDAEFQMMLPSAEPAFYGGFLKHWGVEVEAYASGPFKSFAESFTRTSFSKEARSNLENLIQDLQNKILFVLTTNKKIKEELFYTPILTAKKLIDSGFADSEISESEFLKKEEKYLQQDILNTFENFHQFRFFSRRRPILAVVPLSGGISAGDYSQDQREMGSIQVYPTISLLKELTEDKSVKAIVLEINSPGGSAFHSELLFQEIKRTRETKPVLAFFKDTAASGGYYIGAGAESITALPICITGSIGAVMIRANLKKLYSKVKIAKEAIGFYPYRDILSEYTPLKKDSIQYLTNEIKRVETQFYNRVKEGRGMSDADLKQLGSGRVYLPKVENKVVDKLGGLLDTIDLIKEKFPKERFLYSYELPEYNFRSEISLLGRFTRISIPKPMEPFLELIENKLLDKILYLIPFKIL